MAREISMLVDEERCAIQWESYGAILGLQFGNPTEMKHAVNKYLKRREREGVSVKVRRGQIRGNFRMAGTSKINE